jgi:hypothetical protein
MSTRAFMFAIPLSTAAWACIYLVVRMVTA